MGTERTEDMVAWCVSAHYNGHSGYNLFLYVYPDYNEDDVVIEHDARYKRIVWDFIRSKEVADDMVALFRRIIDNGCVTPQELAEESSSIAFGTSIWEYRNWD